MRRRGANREAYAQAINQGEMDELLLWNLKDKESNPAKSDVVRT